MKKLEKKEMKQIKGGENPFCKRSCNKAYDRCIGLGNDPLFCEGLYLECIDSCNVYP